MEDVDLLHKLQLILPRTFFLTIYRLFIRPHLDCGNVLYCWTSGCTPREKLHEELRSQSGFKVNNRNDRTSCEICSKLATKTPEPRHWNDAVGVFLLSLLLTLDIYHTLFKCFYC